MDALLFVLHASDVGFVRFHHSGDALLVRLLLLELLVAVSHELTANINDKVIAYLVQGLQRVRTYGRTEFRCL